MSTDASTPAPAPEPGLDLALQLASVRRSLEWALVDPSRLAAAPYLGTGCATRVNRLLADREHDAEGPLATLTTLLSSIDETEEPATRLERATAAAGQLAGMVPADLAGLFLPLAEPQGRFVDPRKRRRGERKTKGASPDQATEDIAPAAKTDATPAEGDSAPPAAAGPGSQETVATPDDLPDVVAQALAEACSEPRKQSADAGGRPERQTSRRRLLFGHPDGTGAELSTVCEDPALLAALEAVGVATPADLLLLPPRRFWRPSRFMATVEAEEAVLVRGRVLWRRVLLSPGGRRHEVALSLRDGQRVDCRWLSGAPRGWDSWDADSDVALIGEVVDGDDVYMLYEGEPVGVSGRGSGLVPFYEVEGADEAAVRDQVARLLEAHIGVLEDWMPGSVREDNKLLPLDQALRDAHFPANTDGRGRTRLTFDELLLIQLGIGWRAGRAATGRGLSHKALHGVIGQLTSEHSISLTDSQEQAFCDIRRDLVRPTPMQRLLQGDVGSGSVTIALMSALVVAENGNQVAFLAPDKLAAERRFLHAESLLRSLAIVPLLVGDNIDRASADAIARGEAHIIFGTRALLQEDLKWKRLGMLVVEERAPYGTVTREQLGHLSHQPDLLVLTSTPIPSSLIFAAFGAFEVSVVQAGHSLNVVSTLHESSERDAVYADAQEAVSQGRQVFVAFPVREGRDLLSRRDALRMAKALQSETFSGARIGVYSSEMSRDERSRVFEDFQQRRIDVLVCTTFVEDAPEVSNASFMVVEYADLHDSVRLHRLRGHVGQGWTRGTCAFILSDDPDPADRPKVETVLGVLDGFKLAEHDLEWRGSAVLLGERSGDLPDLRWSEPSRDRLLLLKARDAAFKLLRTDPGLRRSTALARAVHQRWGEWLDRMLPIPEQKRLGAGESKGRRRRRRRRKR